MEELEDELKKELTQFVYQHAWSSDCQTTANYTGFHMINVFIEKLQNKSSNSDYAKCTNCGSAEYKQVTKLDNECLGCGTVYRHFA